MADQVKNTLEDIDNYEQSLNATLAVIHLYRYDRSSSSIDSSIKKWFGKEMNPGEVTPDVLIQLSEKRGVIIELKRSFPRNSDGTDRDLWEEDFKQLKSYDADLTGWETPNGKISEQDLILLTSQKVCIEVIDYITNKKLNFADFSKSFSVWQFNPAPGIKQAVFLQKMYGEITDYKEIRNEDLRRGVTIALDYLFVSGLSKVKFLDYEPNIVYLMSLMWDFIFSRMPTDDDWRRINDGGKQIIEIPITVEQIKEISRNFTLEGHSGLSNELIRTAMEKFIEIKLAKRGKNGAYVIKYRKKIKDNQGDENKHKVFAELLFKDGIQTNLPDDKENDEENSEEDDEE